jgi:hypothetical protein
VVLFLAVLGMQSLPMPPGAPPTDARDPVEEDFCQHLRTIGDAMADAYKRGDKHSGERLEAYFRLVMTDYRQYYREKHPLPDRESEERSWSMPTPYDP